MWHSFTEISVLVRLSRRSLLTGNCTFNCIRQTNAPKKAVSSHGAAALQGADPKLHKVVAIDIFGALGACSVHPPTEMDDVFDSKIVAD